MNKTELLQKLDNKFYLIETPRLRTGGEFGVNYYTVRVIEEITPEVCRDSTVAFWVENEGEVDEKACWQGGEPKPERVERFDAKLQIYLDSKIADGTVEGAFIEESNAELENAIVRAIMDESGTLVEKRLFLDRDTDGKVRHRLIG